MIGSSHNIGRGPKPNRSGVEKNTLNGVSGTVVEKPAIRASKEFALNALAEIKGMLEAEK